jgi:hypothetical protein
MKLSRGTRKATEDKAVLVRLCDGLSGSNEEVATIGGEVIGAGGPSQFDQGLPLCELSLDIIVLLPLETAELGEKTTRTKDRHSNGFLDEMRAPSLPLVEVESAWMSAQGFANFSPAQLVFHLDAFLSYPQVMASNVLFSLSWIPCVLEGGYLV